MRTLLVTLLTAVVAGGPAYAQSAKLSLREAARLEVARQAQAAPAAAPSPGMSPALKWTGIGLLIGGGVTLATGVLVDDACLENTDYTPNYCNDAQTAWVASGAAIAGTGAVLLLIGQHKRSSSPSIIVGPRRVAWRLRF